MDALTLLNQQNSVTVSDLVALGATRHQARHQLEDLAKAGKVLKTKEGQTVSYSRILSAEEGLNAVDKMMDAGAPADVAQVVDKLRLSKALSVAKICQRTKLQRRLVRDCLASAVVMGLAHRPFKRSERYVRAA